MKSVLTSLCILLSVSSFAQVTWSSPVTVAGSSYGNMHPRIALDRSGNPLVLWGNMGSKVAYFSRWTGSAFSTPISLNPAMVDIATASWMGPDIVSFGDTVYVSMKQSPEDTGHLFFTCSINGGMNFSAPQQVDNIGMNVSGFPVLATNDVGNPYLAFMKFDINLHNVRYVFSKSNDWGNSFSLDIPATKGGDSVCDCCPASLICSGNNVVMSYRANLNNIRDMWSCISTNAGNTFNTSAAIDTTNWNLSSCPSSGPDVVIIGDTLYTVFMSGASGKSLVYFNRASVSMASAGSNMPVTGNFSGLNSQNFPRIASAGTAIGIVWVQNAVITKTIVMKFTDSISKGFPMKYDTVALGTTTNADIAMSAGTIHVVWEDDASGVVKYRKGTYPLNAPSLLPEMQKRIPISISPNPASEYFSVAVIDGLDINNCILFDNSGKRFEIKPIKQNGKIIVHTGHLPTGIYSVLLADNSGKTYYSSLMIENK